MAGIVMCLFRKTWVRMYVQAVMYRYATMRLDW
jgi:hypothetical protein